MARSASSATGARGTERRPVVGISAAISPIRVAVFDLDATFVAQRFVEPVAAAGCVPVLLPPLPGIADTVGRLDGLVLMGGPDLDPSHYSDTVHPAIQRSDLNRDAAELALLAAAVEAGLPFLGICRGLQVLNVLRGGTLHQHLPDVVGHDGHSPEGDGFTAQQVRLAPGSRIAEAVGAATTVVPCHHHQAVDRLGTGLVATALAADGVVEAVELPEHPFAVTVQWHEEESQDRGLFQALARAAEHRMDKREGVPDGN
jgi:putative glutamine amidotransferase